MRVTTDPAELHLLSPAGFAASGVTAGLKPSGKPDVGLLVATGVRPAACAAAFSRNRVISPSVVVGREHVADGLLRAVVVNSGNANACTGARGEADARATCREVARLVGCDEREVLPSSTGIIGRLLDMPRLLSGVADARGALGTGRSDAEAFGRAILTTDLVSKQAATRVALCRGSVTISGVTKGSGMIGPMLSVPPLPAPQATMLAYVTTDADVTPVVLRKLLDVAAERTFNRTTVDGHASTNDTAVVLASGASGVGVLGGDVEAFGAALTAVCDSLAYQIAADGEGATKVVTVRVTGAVDEREATLIAAGIAESPLVKCAFHGNDPNWGRVVSMAGVAAARHELGLDADVCTLSICGTPVYARAMPLAFDAADLSGRMAAKAVEIVFDAGTGGPGRSHVYTCDLSRDYIRINADYTT